MLCKCDFFDVNIFGIELNPFKGSFYKLRKELSLV